MNLCVQSYNKMQKKHLLDPSLMNHEVKGISSSFIDPTNHEEKNVFLSTFINSMNHEVKDISISFIDTMNHEVKK